MSLPLPPRSTQKQVAPRSTGLRAGWCGRYFGHLHGPCFAVGALRSSDAALVDSKDSASSSRYCAVGERCGERQHRLGRTAVAGQCTELRTTDVAVVTGPGEAGVGRHVAAHTSCCITGHRRVLQVDVMGKCVDTSACRGRAVAGEGGVVHSYLAGHRVDPAAAARPGRVVARDGRPGHRQVAACRADHPGATVVVHCRIRRDRRHRSKSCRAR